MISRPCVEQASAPGRANGARSRTPARSRTARSPPRSRASRRSVSASSVIRRLSSSTCAVMLDSTARSLAVLIAGSVPYRESGRIAAEREDGRYDEPLPCWLVSTSAALPATCAPCSRARRPRAPTSARRSPRSSPTSATRGDDGRARVHRSASTAADVAEPRVDRGRDRRRARPHRSPALRAALELARDQIVAWHEAQREREPRPRAPRRRGDASSSCPSTAPAATCPAAARRSRRRC